MKRFLLIVAAYLILTAAYSQEFSREVSRAFATGNADVISGNMGNGVDIFIDGAHGRVNGSQAVELLNRFMEQLPWPKFTVIHKSDRGDAGFIIGNLKSDKTTYRVNISYDKIDNKDVIQTIRIEQTDD